MINLIKVDATESTNSFLKELVRNKTIHKTTCVWAKHQTNGKGQMGNTWLAKSGLNLTFSIYTPISNELAKHTIAINLISALSVFKALKQFSLPLLHIKWPNDIMSANKKIGGILIENTYKNGACNGSIIGIGLNINQDKFENLPQASSLKIITSNTFDLEQILNSILMKFETSLKNYDSTNFNLLKKQFEAALFRKGKASTFIKNDQNTRFTGIIQGISNCGKLIVLEEDNLINQYNLKEIRLLF